MSLFERRRATRAAAVAAVAVLSAVTGAATVALIGTGSGGTVRQVTVESADNAAATSGDLTAKQIYERSYKGVVEVSVGGSSSSGEQSSQGQGTGFVYDDEGTIVTNHHVVDGAGSITVTFWDGSKARATLVGSDASTDVAILDVDVAAETLEPLRFGDSSELSVGDPVAAIGSPYGLEETLTTGVVSALDREITAPNEYAIAGAIQTDAAINHGNSGGPLFDANGEVVGITSQIESESGGNVGIGFAVPSNTVKPVVAGLLEDGEVEHAYLGVSLQTTPDGVAVARVVDSSPADDAGLRAATGDTTVNGETYPTGGDVIVEFDGKKVETSAELRDLVGAKKPGDEVTLTVLRSGKQVEVDVVLGTRAS